MKAFFEDVFQYHNHFNQKLADLLLEHAGQITERSIPLFSHMINAHHIWNSRIEKRTPFVQVHDAHTLEKCKDLDQGNFTNTLSILEQSDLNQITEYKTFAGDLFKNTIREILFHVVNHTTHHRGQIISDLRQKGIQPIITDYIFYKR